jgi:hypothetical protein
MIRIAFSILLLSLPYLAQPRTNINLFEGSISLVRESVFDTTLITISVRGQMVRVDERDSHHRIISSHLIDLEKETIFALSPELRLYKQLTVTSPPNNSTSQLKIIKTGNYKKINGYKCYQWRIRDEQRNTEVAYWVAPERFMFLETILSLLNRTELSLKLFQHIPDSQHYFPMLTEERTLLRRMKLQIAVVEIVETSQKPEIFQIPQGYTALRNRF